MTSLFADFDVAATAGAPAEAGGAGMANPAAANVAAVKGGVDSTDWRKKRQEASVQVRKSKREEQLRKRRMTAPAADDQAEEEAAAAAALASGGAVDATVIPSSVSALPRMLAAMRGDDAAARVAGTKALRKLLSKPENPPVQAVVDAGFLPLLNAFLPATDNTTLQFEAAWALTNIGSSDLTSAVVESGSLPLLAPLLMSADPQVREQAAWCIGNISGDCSEYRDLVLDTPGVPQGLLANLEQPVNVSMMRNVTWAVSNLCRGSKPKPALGKVAPYVPVLARIIAGCGDEETITDACWALSYVSDGENARLDVIVDTGVCETLVKLLSSKVEKCIPPCLRTLGNIVTGNDRHTQASLDAGILRQLGPLLEHHKTSVRKEVAWTASNITAGTKEQIGAFLAMPGLPEAIVGALDNGEWSVRKEAAWTVANVCTGGTTEHIQSLVERHNALKPLCDLLSVSDTKILAIVLGALEKILRIDPERYSIMVDEFGGVEAIENLQSHSHNDIYEHAKRLLDDFLVTDDDDDDDLQNSPPSGEFTFSKEDAFNDQPHAAADGASGFNFASTAINF